MQSSSWNFQFPRTDSDASADIAIVCFYSRHGNQNLYEVLFRFFLKLPGRMRSERKTSLKFEEIAFCKVSLNSTSL